jgi:hypothetical protein
MVTKLQKSNSLETVGAFAWHDKIGKDVPHTKLPTAVFVVY